MFPFERSLVKKYQDKPFVLVGVNSDDKEDFEEIVANRTIKWPCFWDGGSPGGPIAKQWSIEGWPTIYILDEKGVIRSEPSGDPREIDDQIYRLLDEMKTKAAAGK